MVGGGRPGRQRRAEAEGGRGVPVRCVQEACSQCTVQLPTDDAKAPGYSWTAAARPARSSLPAPVPAPAPDPA